MNRFDRYTGIKWDVPMYIPNYDKITQAAEEQGKYYKEVQDDYDAITNAAKTAAAQVKYIQDPRVKDASEYKRWLGNIQTQQDEISKAYQQDYRLGMQKLKEYQSNLHRDLTSGEGNYINSRYNRYTKEMAALEEARSKGIYKDDPAFGNYFITGEGASWLGDYDYKPGSGDLNIKTPELQGYWNDEDQQQLIDTMDKMRPSERDLMEAVQNDPTALAELQAYKANNKAVNGSMPFYQLMVSGKISQRTKASLMKFAQGLIQPKANEINFRYKVLNGIDNVVNEDVSKIVNGVLENPLATYVEVPVLDDKGEVKNEDGSIKTEIVLNRSNPLVNNLMTISEGLAFRNVDLKAEHIKDGMAEFEWQHARAAQIEANSRPNTGANVELKGGAMAITPDMIRSRNEGLRKQFAANNNGATLPTGHEVETLTQMIKEARTKGDHGAADELDAIRNQFQRGYAIQSQFEQLAGVEPWNEYLNNRLAGKTLPKTSDDNSPVQFDAQRGELYKEITVGGKTRRVYESDPSMQAKTSRSEAGPTYTPGMGGVFSPSMNIVITPSPFAAAQKELQRIGGEWNTKMQTGVTKYNQTHKPVVNYSSVTPLQTFTGIPLDDKQHLAYKKEVANTVISAVKSNKNIYAISTVLGAEGDITPFTLPAGATNIQPVDPEQLQFNYSGLDNYQFGSQYSTLLPISYDVVNADGKTETFKTTVIAPQTTLDVNTGSQTTNYYITGNGMPEYNAQTWANYKPEITAYGRLQSYGDYNGKKPMVAVTHFDGSTVVKQDGQWWYYDQRGVKRKDPLSSDEALKTATAIVEQNIQMRQGIDPRQTKKVK